jgi:lysophospholipase L1-like esterase
MTTRKKFALRAFALTLACFVSVLVVEGGVRVRQYLRYGSTKNTLYSTIVDGDSGLIIPAPNQSTGTIRINSRGFRSPEISSVKPAGTIRLAFLGASTTFCAEASSNEATWPHLVWKSLQSEWPQIPLEYVNGGVPGYTVASSQRNLQHRVRRLQPDVIVIYHAVNDLSKDTRELAETQGIFRGDVDEPSLLGRWFLSWYLVEKNLDIALRQRQDAKKPNYVKFNADTLPNGFRRRLTDLVRAAQDVAPVVALATFSQRVRRDQSPEERLRASNTHLYYMPHMTPDGLLEAFDAYNRVIRDVALERRAVLIGEEETVPADDLHFNDSVHFKDQGCVRMAARVANGLSGSPRFRQLMNEGAGTGR